MKLRKANLRNILEIIETYKRKDISELKKIKIKWAVRKDSKHLFDDFEGFSFFLINISELMDKADFGEVKNKTEINEFFTDRKESNYRIATALEHWGKGGYMDPPEIYLGWDNKIRFQNGRHRTITAFHLGEKTIPVAIRNETIESISEKIQLKTKLDSF